VLAVAVLAVLLAGHGHDAVRSPVAATPATLTMPGVTAKDRRYPL